MNTLQDVVTFALDHPHTCAGVLVSVFVWHAVNVCRIAMRPMGGNR